MHPDETIIHEILSGDRELYARLVERYAPRTQALAYSYLKDAQAAEDIAQEAFVRAYTSLRMLVAPRLFGAWLAQITRNLSRAALRSRRVQTTPAAPAELAVAPASSEAQYESAQRRVREVLDQALLKLSPKLREAVTLFYFQQQSLRDIADYLGISENTVKQRLHRARGILRDSLDEAVCEELAGLRPSGRFTAGVLASLPLRPVELGMFTQALVKVASCLLVTPWLASMVLVLVVSAGTEWVFISGVRKPYRPAYRRFLRPIWYLTLPIVIVSVVAVSLARDRPLLGIALLLVPSLLPVLILRVWPPLGLFNWRFRLAVASLIATFVFLGLQLYYPYRDDYRLWTQVFLLITLWAMASQTSAILPPAEIQKTAPEQIPAVSMEFLRKSARQFARILNTPICSISRMTVEEDSIRFSTSRLPWFTRHLKSFGTPFDVQLFPDGHVAVHLDHTGPMSANVVEAAEYRSRVENWVRSKWSFYLSGDHRSAKALRLYLQKPDLWRNPKGPRALRYMMPVFLILMAIALGSQLYLREPTLTEAKVRQFYETEFLPRYRQEFAGFPQETPNMLLFFAQPPSMMSIPGVAVAYRDLQRRMLNQTPEITLVHQADKLVHGLEAGYLTIEQLRSWGFTRENLGNVNQRYIDVYKLAKEGAPGNTALDAAPRGLAFGVRLLAALGLLDLMDPSLPQLLLARLVRADGTFRSRSHGGLYELHTTSMVACILHHFDRWDLADREATADWLAQWHRRGVRYDSEQVYWLAVGLVSSGGVQDFSLQQAARIRRPTIGWASQRSPWSIDPADIHVFAINDILRSGRLLELQISRLPVERQDAPGPIIR